VAVVEVSVCGGGHRHRSGGEGGDRCREVSMAVEEIGVEETGGDLEF
jgi:hypothetical protein